MYYIHVIVMLSPSLLTFLSSSLPYLLSISPSLPPLSSTLSFLPPLPPPLSSESDDSSSQMDAVDTNKLYWGLSTSSCNLAKDLLAEPYLTSCDSETPLVTYSTSTYSPHSPNSPLSHSHSSTKAVVITGRSPSQPRLSHTHSKKLCQLLLNIQEERLCQVCMGSKISAVFCPCGHHVACYRCAKRLVKCPICRQPLGYVQYVYTH